MKSTGGSGGPKLLAICSSLTSRALSAVFDGSFMSSLLTDGGDLLQKFDLAQIESFDYTDVTFLLV